LPRLKRVVTLREALSINLAAIIGAGIYVISGLAAGTAGPASIIAILIGGVASIFTGFSFAELAHLYASEGGNYEYSREVLGNYAGFIAGIVWVLGSMVGGAAIALSFAGYLNSLLNIHFSETIEAAILVIVLALINYFGIKRSAELATFLTILNICVLLFFVLVGVFFIKPSNYVPVFPKGLSSMFVASAFVFFAYTGFARVTMLGDEIKEPRKTIPRAIIYSILISTLVYASVMFVLIGIVSYSSVSRSSSPLAYALISATRNPLFGYVIDVGALIATFDVDLAMILGLSRVLFAMSHDKAIPRHFSQLNKYSVPHFSILASAIVMIGILPLAFKEIVSLSNAGSLFSYTLANIAAIKLTLANRKNPEKLIVNKRNAFLLPIIGAFTTIGLLVFLTPLSLEILACVLVGVSAYYFATGKHLRRIIEHERKENW